MAFMKPKEPWELTVKEIEEAPVAIAPKLLKGHEIKELINMPLHNRIHPEIDRDEVKAIELEQKRSIYKKQKIDISH